MLKEQFEKVKSMSLDEKLGQIFVTGFPAEDMNDSFKELVKKYKLGNVILFKENITSQHQLKKLCSDIQELITAETGHPAFISIDEEGGVVSRLSADAAKMPSALALSALREPDTVRKCARVTGSVLKMLGVNFNLAPVLDVNSNVKNPVIGVRSYGTDADEALKYATQALKGYEEARIMCSGKHFPGHGDTSSDSHLTLPFSKKTLEELHETELKPFFNAVKEGIPAMTVAHVVYECLDSLPATMSRKIVTDILRKEAGFQGLIISDCMEMNAISKEYGTENGVISALKAGIELIFISHRHDLVISSVEKIKSALNNGELTQDIIDAAVAKILYFKEIYACDAGTANDFSLDFADLSLEREAAHSDGDDFKNADEITGVFINDKYLKEAKKYADEIFLRTLKKSGGDKFRLRENPLFIAPKQTQVSQVSNNTSDLSLAVSLQNEFGGQAIEISLDPDEEEIKKALSYAANASSAVIGTLNATVYKGQSELLKRLISLKRENAREGVDREMDVAVITLRNPFELETIAGDILKIALYEYSARSVRAAADILRKLNE